MYSFIKDNMLIITKSSYKNEILKYLSENKILCNLKFMTIDEYKKKYFFDYDEKTINYLVKDGMKVENAITLLENLYYIEHKEYHNEKLDYLVKVKEELDNNNLLIYDKMFPILLKKYEICVYGYGMLNEYEMRILSNPKVINYKQQNSHFKVFHHKSINEEVECVFQKISELLLDNVDINKIYLMNINDEYYPIIKRYSLLYDIPVNIPYLDSLMGTVIGNKFYKAVDSGYKSDEIINLLKEYQNEECYDLLLNILNKYIDCNLIDYKEQIKYDLENTKVISNNYFDTVGIKNIYDNVNSSEYIFLMNFNNPSIPKLFLDTDYIQDDIKHLVGIPTCDNLNSLSKENTLNYLCSINNLFISYKDMTPFNTYYPSILLDNIDYEIIPYVRDFTYSDKANKLLYTSYLDDYIKYGIKNKYLDTLYFNYQKNNYLDYNNQFDYIDNINLKKRLNNELVLSYSSIDNYYKCAFKYYLSNILKIDLYEETFMTFVGSLFHDVLSHIHDDDFDLDRQYDLFLKDRIFNYKEKFFLERLKYELEDIISVIKKQENLTGLNNYLFEKRVDIPLSTNPFIHFKGFIDKIMYKEKGNETIVSIIDYKTGNIDIKIKNLEFGLSMQLPIYLYLVFKSNIFNNPKFAGFYLQHIINTSKMHGDKGLLKQKEEKMKLTGYSTSDISRLSIFDSSYENSEMIHGMKLNKDGNFSYYANIVSDSEIKDIINITERKINDAKDNILKGNFYINPKILDSLNVSCTYCKYSDICYHNEKNNIYLKKEEEVNANLDERTE